MILVKTESGQQAFKERSVRLTPRQRSAFILFDGRRSIIDVLTAGLGVERGDIEQMLEHGLLQAADTAVSGSAGATESAATMGKAGEPSAQGHAPVPERSPQERYQDAYPVATRLTAGLGLRGFRLNLSVEGSSTYQELLTLAPRIRAAVGEEKAQALDRALGL